MIACYERVWAESSRTELLSSQMHTLHTTLKLQIPSAILIEVNLISTMLTISSSNSGKFFQQWVSRFEENPGRFSSKNLHHYERLKTHNGETLTAKALEQSLANREALGMRQYKPVRGELQSLAQCLFRMQDTTIDPISPEPLPMNFKKDEHMPESSFVPHSYLAFTADYLIGDKKATKQLRQVPKALNLLSKILFGDRTGLQGKIHPLYIQVPRDSLLKDNPKNNSEMITVLIKVDELSVKLNIQVKEFSTGTFAGMEYIDVTMTTVFAHSITNDTVARG